MLGDVVRSLLEFPTCLPPAMRDQFHEEGASWLGHGVDDRRERYRIGVARVKGISHTEPDVKIPQQVPGGQSKIGEVNRLERNSRQRPPRRGVLHPAAHVEFS